MKQLTLNSSLPLLALCLIGISFSALINTTSPINTSLAFIDTLIVNSTFIESTKVANRTNQAQKANSTQAIDDDLEELKIFFPEDIQGGIQCGCYIRQLPVPKLKSVKRMVPLKNINYDLEIVNSLAHITLQQQYENPSKRYLNVYYSFPIRPDSALYKLVAEFDNVVIQGIVKQKDQARQQYEQAKSQGRLVALGSLDKNSKDIINLEIGNIPPKTKVKITISFIQEMTLARNTFYSIQVPSTISPRYMNTVPSSVNTPNTPNNPQLSNSSSPFISSKQVLAKPGYTWDFKITLKTTRKIVFSNSPTHKLVKESKSKDGLETQFRLSKQSIPNKDFVFVYTPEDFDIPDYVVGYNGDTTTVLVSFIPQFSQLKPEDAYEDFKNNKTAEFDLDSVRGEYIFILDRSGSMEGRRIQQAVQSLSIFLKSLPSDSYFNVISFGSNYEKMFSESVKNDNKIIKKAISDVQKMGANFGGTQIYYPLENALSQKQIDGYPRFIFLLTDGTVGNTEGVIQMARKKSKNVRISSIGIGNGASFRLIEGTAEAGRGKYVMISDTENPSQKIISLLESSLTPLITKLTLKYEKKGIQSIIPNPDKLPYIIKDSIANFYLTYKGKVTQPIPITLQYEDSVSKKTFKSSVEAKLGKQEYPYVDKMAHFKVLRALQNIAKDTKALPQQDLVYIPAKDYAKEATDYSIKYQILSEYTSFLAVGKELVDKEKKQFKKLGTQIIEVAQTKPIEYVQPQRFFTSSSSPSFSRAAAGGYSQSARPTFAVPTSFGGISSASFSASSLSVSKLPLVPQASSSSAFIAPAPSASPSPSHSMTTSIPSYALNPTSNSLTIDSLEPINQQVQKKTAQSTNSLSVSDIMSMQNIDGSWSDQSVIKSISKNPEAVTNLFKKMDKSYVISYLVDQWLKKQNIGKQYSIMMKKLESYLKKAEKDPKYDITLLSKLELK